MIQNVIMTRKLNIWLDLFNTTVYTTNISCNCFYNHSIQLSNKQWQKITDLTNNVKNFQNIFQVIVLLCNKVDNDEQAFLICSRIFVNNLIVVIRENQSYIEKVLND